MSLEIVRIVGESFDLRTGQESPKGVVLSNGHHEITLPVDDRQLGIILKFWGEGMEPGPPKGKNGHAQVEPQTWAEPPRFVEERVNPNTFDTVQEDDELGPGEMYEDALTGAASI